MTDREKAISEIKVVDNFISGEDIDFYIKYIDSHLDLFQESSVHGSLRKTLIFGKDTAHKKSFTDLSIISDLEEKLRKELFPNIQDAASRLYNNRRSLYVSSMFLAKQSSGAQIEQHVDTDGGENMQFKYSGIIYLNTMFSGGELTFPDLDYTYSPKAGQLVLFPSRPLEYLHSVATINEDRYTIPIWLTEYEFFSI